MFIWCVCLYIYEKNKRKTLDIALALQTEGFLYIILGEKDGVDTFHRIIAGKI